MLKYGLLYLMLTAAIITISDGVWRGERPDESGQVIKERLSMLGWHLARYEVVPDEVKVISDKLAQWADEGKIDIILTNGGTGLAPRDVTPEATLAIVDRVVPGLAEMMRVQTFSRTPFSMLSRAVAGVRKSCLIINLPGSPKAVRECLEVILPALPHAVGIIKGEITQHEKEKGED